MPKPTYTFVSVATCAYSGATLLAFFLGAHPEIASLGEMDGLIPTEDPERYQCSCRQKIRECHFWARVAEGMARRGFLFDPGNFDLRFSVPGSKVIRYLRTASSGIPLMDSIRDFAFLTLTSEGPRTAALAARNVAFVETVLEVTGKRILVDTSKGLLRLPALARLSGLDLRAIHLVRDVRGVVASRKRRETPLPVTRMARQWATNNRRIQALLGRLFGHRYLRIRYEDLCRDLEGTLRSIQEFCGCQQVLLSLDPAKTPHHIVGNPMRLRGAPGVQIDEQWRKLLTGQEQENIRKVANPLIRRFGYA
ncbi:MAG: sulfotransferase [Acidobacteriota bacterium]